MTPEATRSNKWRNIILLALLLLVVGIAAQAMKQQSNNGLAAGSTAFVGRGLAAFETDKDRATEGSQLMAPGSGGESGELQSIEDFWYTRISYPTGKFNGLWLQKAAQQDKNIQVKVPAGLATYRKSSASPLTLNPVTWTALGPAPENEPPYGHTAGRVNDIVIDPVTTNVAYMASVAGGVWKTTNCCTAATSWTLTAIDNPLVNSTAIDDLSIDPSNHNTIYAGTGDLNFGSFSMGSTGISRAPTRGIVDRKGR